MLSLMADKGLFMNRLTSILFVIFIVLLTGSAWGVDRCVEFVQPVRSQSVKQFGYQFPYWYHLGVMVNESACRPDIISFDGGIGLYQFTSRTGVLKDIESGLHEKVNPSNPDSSIRAYVYYIAQIIRRLTDTEKLNFKGVVIYPKKYEEACGLRLADVFQVYNGGLWLIKEYQALGDCNRDKIKSGCKRGGVYVGKRWLSFCETNYSYPTKVYRYSQKYRQGKTDGAYNYW